MASLASNASITITLAPGDTLTTVGAGTAVFGPGPLSSQQRGLNGTVTLGPFYDRTQVVYLTAGGAALTYTQNVFSTTTPSASVGPVAISAPLGYSPQIINAIVGETGGDARIPVNASYPIQVSHSLAPFYRKYRAVRGKGLMVTFPNFSRDNTGEVVYGGQLRIKAYLKYSGVFYPLKTDGGAAELIIPANTAYGHMYLSFADCPLLTPEVQIAKNLVIYTRCILDTAVGNTASQMPCRYFEDGTNAPGVAIATGDINSALMTADYSDGSTFPTAKLSGTFGAGYGPIALTTWTQGAKGGIVGGIGDSIYQSGGSYSGGYPAANRGCDLAGASYIEFANTNTRLYQTVGKHVNRLQLLKDLGARAVVCGFLTNDHIDGRSLAQIQADCQSIWKSVHDLGMAVIMPTTPPQTDAGNTAPSGANYTGGASSIWGQANDWIRAQATAGAIEAVAEFALAVGTSAGLWTSASLTYDGRHPSDAGAKAGASAFRDAVWQALS